MAHMTMVPAHERMVEQPLWTEGDPIGRARVVEKRDPTAATRPVVYQSPGQPQIPQWDAMNALRFGYYANTFVYRCIQVRALALASLPIRVGADPDKPQDFDKRHPLARLLGPPPGGPNMNFSGASLVAWSLAQLDATGRVGWELELGPRDVPVAIWQMPAPYLKPIPTEAGARYFSRFTFGRPGEERSLPAERVFYHWRPRADDVRQPESVMDAARYDISVAVMQDRYDHAFLKNDARPAAVIIYEGFETDDEDNAFKRQFRNDFQGPDNAGRSMFAEADRGESGVGGALDIKTLGLTQKDARFIERYSSKIRAICVAFGVPLTVLGDASDRTFANASEEFRVFWAQTMLALVSEMADAINLKLAPLFGDNVCWFDLSKVEALRRQTDPVTAQVGAPSMVQAQLMTINEARADYGLPPVPDGDRFMTAAEIMALQSNAPAVAPPRMGGGGAGGQVAVPAATDPTPAPQKARPERVLPVPVPAVPALEERAVQRRVRAVATSTAQIGALEQSWARSFRALFARQAAEVLQRLNGKRGRQATRETRAEPDGIFRKPHWEQVTRQEAEALIESTFTAGAGRVAGEFGVTFDLEAPYVREFISSRANQLAGQVTDTTYAQITDALSEGVQAGEPIQEIAKRVRHVFDIASDVRAETIARTEVISAYNGSAATVAGQLPSDVVGGQEWIAVEDARTRPKHAAADGEVVPIGQPFIATGVPMAYPGDPNGGADNTVNCRCTVAFLTPEEMDARGGWVEKRTALALLAMVNPGAPMDEIAFRRALREARAA